ncbi:MAG TPA: hypothetical protein VKK61_12130 [Tepidisphaeraceae bacterium]|nr:hypothetical protein [Tepidisphaeraceae bacterium]
MALSSRNFQLILLATAALSGCKWLNKPKPPPPTSAPAPEVTWNTQPVPVPQQPPMAVKEGGVPLVYLVETSAMVRVADETAKQDLLSIPVPGKTIIAVSEGGVSVGGATMKLGPLPSDHRYAIYLQSNETNVIRTGTIRPGKPGQPAPTTQNSP